MAISSLMTASDCGVTSGDEFVAGNAGVRIGITSLDA
jgi:hypothetical protein